MRFCCRRLNSHTFEFLTRISILREGDSSELLLFKLPLVCEDDRGDYRHTYSWLHVRKHTHTHTHSVHSGVVTMTSVMVVFVGCISDSAPQSITMTTSSSHMTLFESLTTCRHVTQVASTHHSVMNTKCHKNLSSEGFSGATNGWRFPSFPWQTAGFGRH